MVFLRNVSVQILSYTRLHARFGRAGGSSEVKTTWIGPVLGLGSVDFQFSRECIKHKVSQRSLFKSPLRTPSAAIG